MSAFRFSNPNSGIVLLAANFIWYPNLQNHCLKIKPNLKKPIKSSLNNITIQVLTLKTHIIFPLFLILILCPATNHIEIYHSLFIRLNLKRLELITIESLLKINYVPSTANYLLNNFSYTKVGVSKAEMLFELH